MRGKADYEDIVKVRRAIFKSLLQNEMDQEGSSPQEIIDEVFDEYLTMFECEWCGKKVLPQDGSCDCPDGVPF